MGEKAKVVNMPVAGVKTPDGKLYMAAVKVSDLHVEKDFNARKALTRLDELAADLKRNGQDTPITIADRLDGKPGYMVVAGHRRTAAAKLAGLETLSANYIGKHTWAELQAISLRENIGRESLSRYEIAKSFEAMSDHGMTGAQIEAAMAVAAQSDPDAKAKNFTLAYILKLVKMVREVHPKIQAEWAAGNPLCTMAFLQEMAKDEMGKGHMDAQLAAWKALTDPANTEESPDQTDSPTGPTTPQAAVVAKVGRKRASQKELEDALAGVVYCINTSVSKRTAEEYAGMRDALRYALGFGRSKAGNITIKGAWDKDVDALMNPPKE